MTNHICLWFCTILDICSFNDCPVKIVKNLFFFGDDTQFVNDFGSLKINQRFLMSFSTFVFTNMYNKPRTNVNTPRMKKIIKITTKILESSTLFRSMFDAVGSIFFQVIRLSCLVKQMKGFMYFISLSYLFSFFFQIDKAFFS